MGFRAGLASPRLVLADAPPFPLPFNNSQSMMNYYVSSVLSPANPSQHSGSVATVSIASVGSVHSSSGPEGAHSASQYEGAPRNGDTSSATLFAAQPPSTLSTSKMSVYSGVTSLEAPPTQLPFFGGNPAEQASFSARMQPPASSMGGQYGYGLPYPMESMFQQSYSAGVMNTLMMQQYEQPGGMSSGSPLYRGGGASNAPHPGSPFFMQAAQHMSAPPERQRQQSQFHPVHDPRMGRQYQAPVAYEGGRADMGAWPHGQPSPNFQSSRGGRRGPAIRGGWSGGAGGADGMRDFEGSRGNAGPGGRGKGRGGNYQDAPPQQSKNAVVSHFLDRSEPLPSLSEIVPHAFDFACDPRGASYLLHVLPLVLSARPQGRPLNDAASALLSRLCAEAEAISLHPSAHQIFLLFLGQGSSEEQLLITQLSLLGKMSSLSFHTHGCRVVQKAISCLPRELAEALANELDEGLLARCVEDSNANHVLSAIASELAPDSAPSLYRFAKNSAKQLAMHPYGCRLVQRILEKKSVHSMEVANILLEHVVLLSTDSFG